MCFRHFYVWCLDLALSNSFSILRYLIFPIALAVQHKTQGTDPIVFILGHVISETARFTTLNFFVSAILHVMLRHRICDVWSSLITTPMVLLIKQSMVFGSTVVFKPQISQIKDHSQRACKFHISSLENVQVSIWLQKFDTVTSKESDPTAHENQRTYAEDLWMNWLSCMVYLQSIHSFFHSLVGRL